MTTTQLPYAANILIVDDMPANVLLLVRMLTDRGYIPHSVLSGPAALQSALETPPDLILLDINMPVMNGFEVCERLKSDVSLKDIPVIFISALNETIDKVKAFRVGGVDYVTKPFQFEEVCSRIEAHLKIRYLQRQLSDQNENLELLVAERTRELAKTYGQLQEMGRLKDGFIRMLSHEIRTPANGILGIGNLLLALCPASDRLDRYRDLFNQSSLRLQNLIEDAALLTDMDKLALKQGTAISRSTLLVDVASALPNIEIHCEPSAECETVNLRGYPPLLTRALVSMFRLSTYFSLNKKCIHVRQTVLERALCLRIAVDALSLSGEQVAEFFELDSAVRAVSSAESMGLAPVVAYQIFAAFGGELKFVKGIGQAGYVEATFLIEEPHV
jgi:two-component system, sensor histidine kinase and response regulator